MEGSVVVAACDSELVGKTCRGGGLKLEVDAGFYGTDEVEEEALVNFLASCTTANLVGKRCVKAAVDAGYVDESCVMLIGKVPHAQIYRM